MLSAITPRPKKSPGVLFSAISLDSDLRSISVYTEHTFSAAFENSLSDSWTAWSFFSYTLASVEILFSILKVVLDPWVGFVSPLFQSCV